MKSEDLGVWTATSKLTPLAKFVNFGGYDDHGNFHMHKCMRPTSSPAMMRVSST